MSCDVCLKFIIIGDAGCGKTCVLHRFTENQFTEDTTHTVGVEYGTKIVTIGEKAVKLQCWDTAGQERFKSVTHTYYRDSIGCLLVYDITSRESFNHITNWLSDCRQLAHPSVQIVMVGNKADLNADREVTYMEAARFAQENELVFVESSAATGQNIDEIFLKCARIILTKIDDGTIPPESFASGIQFTSAASRKNDDSTSSTSARRRVQPKSRDEPFREREVIDLRTRHQDKTSCC